MKTQNFTTTISVDQTPQEAFAAINKMGVSRGGRRITYPSENWRRWFRSMAQRFATGPLTE